MSSSGSSGNDQVMNAKLLVVSLIILATVLLVFVLMHLYARWMWVNTRYTRWQWLWRDVEIAHTAHAASAAPPPADTGLDQRILEALPSFTFSKNNTTEAMECSVCIAEFQEKESARMLPGCHHCFHTACIDLWLQSHATCPLCRIKLVAPRPVDRQQTLRGGGDEDTTTLPPPPAAASSHERSDRQAAIAIDIGRDDAETGSMTEPSTRGGEGSIKTIVDCRLVIDVSSRVTIDLPDPTPGATPWPSASPSDRSKPPSSPLSQLRRMLSTRGRKSAIPASPKGTGTDEASSLQKDGETALPAHSARQ